MQLIPDQQNSRMTAILVLVIAVILVYLLCFHWFFQRHAAYAEEVGQLSEQLARFESVAAQREPLTEQLTVIRNSREDASLFLGEGDFNEAAAAMSDRLGSMVGAQSDDCQIVSRQPVRPRVQERYQRVTVNARMRCSAEEFMEILYRLEAEVPMILVDDLNVTKPRTRRSSRSADSDAAPGLDIRFNMSGYLRE